jgi:hypothetical protein
MQTVQNFSAWFSKQKLFGKVAIGCSGLFILCCLCSVPVAILNPSTPTPQVSNPSVAEVQATPLAGETQMPTNIPVTDTPVPTAIPTLPPVGETRDNPAPVGTPIDIGGDMVFTIISGVRPADSVVINANMFNTQPEGNQEYVQLDVQVVCNKSSNDKCYFSPYEIKAVGVDGNVRDTEIMIAGIDGLIESGEFFGGATRSGKMFYIVPKDDKTVVLFYEPLFGNPIYIAIP